MLATVLEGVTWNSLLSGDPSPLYSRAKMAELAVLVLLTLKGVLVQVTTNVPLGPMATRGWFCTPGVCTPSRELIHLELRADGLAREVVNPCIDVRNANAGRAGRGAGPDDDEVAQGVHRDGRRAPGGGRRGVHRELRADLQPLGVVKLADDVGLLVDVAGPDDHVIAADTGGDRRIDLQAAAGRVDGRVGLRQARREGGLPLGRRSVERDLLREIGARRIEAVEVQRVAVNVAESGLADARRGGRHGVEDFYGVRAAGQRCALSLRVRTASHLLSGISALGFDVNWAPYVWAIVAASLSP